MFYYSWLHKLLVAKLLYNSLWLSIRPSIRNAMGEMGFTQLVKYIPIIIIMHLDIWHPWQSD